MKVFSWNFNYSCSFSDVLPFFNKRKVSHCNSSLRTYLSGTKLYLSVIHFIYLTVLSQNRSQYEIIIDRLYCAKFAL